jgi:hypothetical protein
MGKPVSRVEWPTDSLHHFFNASNVDRMLSVGQLGNNPGHRSRAPRVMLRERSGYPCKLLQPNYCSPHMLSHRVHSDSVIC